MALIAKTEYDKLQQQLNDERKQQINTLFKFWSGRISNYNVGSCTDVDPYGLASGIIENKLFPSITTETNCASRGQRVGAYKFLVLVNPGEVYKALLHWCHYLIKFIDGKGKTIRLNANERQMLYDYIVWCDFNIESVIKYMYGYLINKPFCAALFINNMAIGSNRFNSDYRREGKIKGFICAQKLVREDDGWNTLGTNYDCMKYGLGFDNARIKREKNKHDPTFTMTHAEKRTYYEEQKAL
eukprot:UN11114